MGKVILTTSGYNIQNMETVQWYRRLTLEIHNQCAKSIQFKADYTLLQKNKIVSVFCAKSVIEFKRIFF